MSQLDREYRKHIESLVEHEERITALDNYKSDTYSRLNRSMKAGNTEDSSALNLLKAIRAKCQNQLTVYRMTSDMDFICRSIDLLLNKELVYPAFMSCSRERDSILNFIPGNGYIPLLLTINLPSNFPIALMEGKDGVGGFEQEILVPAGSVFSIENDPVLLDDSGEIIKILGYLYEEIPKLYMLTLNGMRPHNYFNGISANEFFNFSSF